MKTFPPQSVPTPAELAIAGSGLICRAGNQPFALYGAVAVNLAGACPHPVLATQVHGARQAPILTASLPQFDGLDAPHDRITALAAQALPAAATQLPDNLGGALLVLTLIPATDTPRGKNLDLPRLQATLAASHPRLTNASFRFATPEEGAVAQLQTACAELAQGTWGGILFGGIDSLVDKGTCVQLLSEHRIMTTGGTGGIVPGEGAAWLALLAPEPGHPRVRISAMATAVEPHVGQADEKQMTGLTTAMQTALQAADLSPAALESIVLPFGADTLDVLEWHQTVEALWSRRDNTPRRFEELRPIATLGDTGAAALPLALALGCARFDFTFPATPHVLVLEASSHGPRGALCLNKINPKPSAA